MHGILKNYLLKDYLNIIKHWAEEQFGEKYSDEIAEILSKYTKYNSRRKPELLIS